VHLRWKVSRITEAIGDTFDFTVTIVNMQHQRHRLNPAVVLILVAFSLGIHSASAEQVTVTFSGTIDHSTDYNSVSELGVPFSGVLSYDSHDPLLLTVPATANTPALEEYTFGPTDSLILNIGSYTFSAYGTFGSQNLLLVGSGPNVDLFSVSALYGSDITSNFPGFAPYNLGFEVAGPPGLLTNPGLPTSFNFSDVVTPGYGGYTSGVSIDGYVSGSDLDIFGGNNYSSLEVTETPEPSTNMLVSLGLVGIVLRRKLANR
jgi:PEP-CTERM motif